MVIVIKKDATPDEIRAALAQFNVQPQPAQEGPSFFGALKRSRDGMSGLAYQRKIRED